MSREAIIIYIVRVKAVYQSVDVNLKRGVSDGTTRQTLDCSREFNATDFLVFGRPSSSKVTLKNLTL